ncbi:Putative F-box protein PP2-B12 [Linum grandiflorum]
MEGGNAGGDSTEAAGLRDTIFDDLPEGCVVKILSFVTPVDTCRSSSVSSFFRSAASSDALWETFLPSDYNSLLSNFAAAALPPFSSKKELFRILSSPIIYDDGKKSFWLDKMTGNKSYMLSARDLSIESADNPHNWDWIKHDRSRFAISFFRLFCKCISSFHFIFSSKMLPQSADSQRWPSLSPCLLSTSAPKSLLR